MNTADRQPSAESTIRSAVARVLQQIAPEVDPSGIPDTANLRRELDLDSVDFQNFVIGLSRELRVEITERDAPQLQTLAGCVACLQHRHSAVD